MVHCLWNSMVHCLWNCGLVSLFLGALLGFLFGWGREFLKERRDRTLLKEAIYQEVANNLQALWYWTDPARGDFDWLKENIYREITFFTHEAAAKRPAAAWMPGHASR